jgi:predicted ArsR family transcriptional regulator
MFSLLPTETKGELLLLIKQRGTISLDDAEEATGLTRTTLREHLSQLERDGLVERSTMRHGRGRPSLRYSITPEGERLFPSRDHLLLGRLLEFLEDNGEGDLIDVFFAQFWEQRLRDAEYRMADIPQDDKRARLAVIETLLEEQGFMPEIVENVEGILIRECNCPFPEAVKRTRLPCILEARFFERILNERVGRVTYIPDGSPACTYQFSSIEPRDDQESAGEEKH